MKTLLHKAALVVAFILAVAQCHPSWGQSPRLAPANSMNSATYLILTVPIAEPDVLTATADRLVSRFGVRLAAEWPLEAIAVHCFVIDASDVAEIEDLVARISSDKDIRTVQAMQDFTTLEKSDGDPLLPAQTALQQMKLPAIRRLSKGTGITVAVIDTAIDVAHPDLASRVIKQMDFVGLHPLETAEAHGTAVAGIIAADATNGIGIAGVAPEAAILGLRACWQEGRSGHCNSFSLARALNVAVRDGVDIINMSLGGPPDALLGELVQAALSKGIVVVAATGESSTLAFPASAPGVVAAGPVHKAISAPSIDVLSTAPDSGYRYVSGSSVAAAHVTGVAALMRAARPGLGQDVIAHALRDAVTKRGETRTLDACRALMAVIDATVDCN
ncbi:S8 family serine peptidase [Agrobacterium sp. B1(2019)]|uniref:S8 family peptidase n=1 Tax=Agrobacterium sp. B1(2019) TaxID=2607032 RepID=UPI0011F073BC|nr:S8 family serine peptidase [Agrobacterium sp. B1(2019)]TZG32240.1 S8 family serine peptidase [Agrobacterium sp. B1(2019)]